MVCGGKCFRYVLYEIEGKRMRKICASNKILTHVYSIVDLCRYFAYLLLVVAWIFSVCIIADCTFLRIGLSGTAYGDLDEYGIFEFNLDAPGGHRCAAYSGGTPISAGFKAARAFGVLTSLLLGVAMMQVACLELFTDYKRARMWAMVRVQVMLSLLCQLLTFSAFAEESCGFPGSKCVPGAVGILAIFNVVILLVISWMYCVISPPDYPMFEVRRRAPPPPTGAPPTLEEQEKELRGAQEAVEVSMEESRATMTSTSGGSYRGPAEDDDVDIMPPPAPSRNNDSFNDGIENPAVSLDKIDEESF